MTPCTRRPRRLASHLALPALFCSTIAGLTLAVSEQPALAVGEQAGRLRGAVTEAGSKSPIPGAKVEISSPNLIGGSKSQITDEMGRFDFPNVPPGSYTITVLYEGVRPVRRRVSVLLGQTQDVDIPFAAELAAVETTTIVEERRRLDPDRQGTTVVLTAENQSKLATQRSYQSIVQQAPGVVGGGNPIMAGGTTRHNRYLVDGLDVTDPVTNTFSANFNFDAISQVEAIVTPVDAQYNSLGGVINLTTKRGSNYFEVDSSFYFNHQALSSGGTAGTQLYNARLSNQFDPKPPQARYQANINIGGPIVKDKLWFYLSTELRYTLLSAVPGPPLNVQHPSREFKGLYPRLNLTWAPASRHRISLSINADPAFITNLRNSNRYAPEAEYDQLQGGSSGVLNYDWNIRDNLIFSLQTGLQFQRLVISPHNGDVFNSAHSDRTSLIISNAADGFRSQDDQRWRFQFDPSIKWIKKGWLGEHTFKAGVQVTYLRHYQYYRTPGDSLYTDQIGTGPLARPTTDTALPAQCNPAQPFIGGASPCFRLTQYEPPIAQTQGGWSAGLFLQDTWKPIRWLTITPGLRIDYGTANNSLGQVVQNFLGFGPRLAAALDVTRDGRTFIKASYGRSNEVSTLLNAASADRGGAQSLWNFNPASGRFDSFFTSSGGGDGYDLRGHCTPGDKPTLACGNARLNLDPPHADMVILSVERELFQNVMGSISYTFRQHSNQWQSIELNALRTLDGGDYASFADPRYGSITAYRPMSAARRRYDGIDFVVDGQPSKSWYVRAAYTLSFLKGTVDDQFDSEGNGAPGADPPRNFLLNGYLADDHRHQVKIQTNYTFAGLTAGAVFTYLSGSPTTRLYLRNIGYVGRQGWRGVDPSAGGDPNNIRSWSELRSPDLVVIDLRVQYDLDAIFKKGHHLYVIADLFNVLDLTQPVGANNQFGFQNQNSALFGTVLDRQSPFQAQLALRYQWGGAPVAR